MSEQTIPAPGAAPRWVKEGFAALSAVLIVGAGIAKAIQLSAATPGRAIAAVKADQLDLQPPPLKLASRAGAQVDLSQYRGKAVLVHFWATWCAPCRDELPLVEKISQRFDPATFEVLAVSVDETWDAVDGFLPKTSPLPVLLDPDGVTSKAFGTTMFPETYLVDREGRIRLKFVGSRNWLEPSMATIFESFGVKPRT